MSNRTIQAQEAKRGGTVKAPAAARKGGTALAALLMVGGWCLPAAGVERSETKRERVRVAAQTPAQMMQSDGVPERYYFARRPTATQPPIIARATSGGPAAPEETTDLSLPAGKSVGGPSIASTGDAAGGPAPKIAGDTFVEFPGPTFTGVFPPDTSIAVGPSTVLVAVNGEISAYSRSGNRLWVVRDDQFFDAVNEDDAINFFTDPKVLYDPTSQRFFIIELGLVSNAGGISNSFFLFGVSRSSEPANALDESWRLFANNSQINGAWSDYPGFAVDQNSVYVTGNWFSGTTFQYDASHIRVFAKPQFLLTSQGTIELAFVDNLEVTDTNGVQASTIMPSVNYTPTQETYFVSSSDFTTGFGIPRTDQLYVYSIDGTNAPRNVRKLPINIKDVNTLGEYAQPPLVNANGQPVDSLGLRILNVVRVANDLWCTHSVADELGIGAACRWYRLRINGVNQVSLIDQGIVRNPSGSAWLPGICANKFGDAVLFHTRAGPSQFPSFFYSFRIFSDPPGFMSAPVLVEQGQSVYDFFRWGDYAPPAVDPLDESTIWGFHMYANQAGTWSTRICGVSLTFGSGGGGGPIDPCSTSLAITAPTTAQNLVTGQSDRIKWTFGGDANNPIDLLLVKGNAILGTIVANVAAGNDEFNWNVGTITPAQTVNTGDDYRVMIRPTFCEQPLALSPFFSITRTVQANAAPPEATLPGGATVPQVLIGAAESAVLGALNPTDGSVIAGQFGKPPYTYEWTPPDFLDNPSLPRPTARPTINVTYTLAVRDSTGTVDTDQVRVVIGNPLRVDAGPSKTFRGGGSVLLEGSASGGTPPYSYEWDPLPNSADPGTAAQAQPMASPTNPTVFTLRVTDSIGTIVTDTVSVVPGLALKIINNPGNGGTVTRDVIKNLYAPGDQLLVSAVPNPGFTFVRWDAPGPEFDNRPASGNFSQNPTNLTIQTSDVTLRPIYQPITPTQTLPGTIPLIPGTTCGVLMPTTLAGLALGLGLLRRRFR